MAKRKRLLCTYCKGTESFTDDKGYAHWGVRCKLTSGYPIRNFPTEQQAQRSIDEWCTGDGRRGCRIYLLTMTNLQNGFSGDLLREFDAMEAATMAKQTYYCACGKTFSKSSSAQDTGYRMDDYNEAHECYGCPFVEPVKDWNTGTDKSYECRASVDKTNYTTTGSIALDTDHAARMYTLDLPWLDAFINFYLDTPGGGRKIENRDPVALEKAFRLTGLNKGRRSYSFEFEKNKLGRAARKIVHDEFLNEKGEAYQLGCGPPDPKVRVLQMIEHAKQIAREGAMQMEDEIFGVEEIDTLAVFAPEESCPYFISSIPKKGGGYIVTCETDKTAQLICRDDGAHIVKMRMCNEGHHIECRCFLFGQLKEAGLQPSSEYSDSELRNMYDGLQLKQQEAAQSPPELPAEQEPTAIFAAEQRGITEVTAEIRYYKAQTVQNIIEIGKRLIEAKELLEHGQWGEWLEHSVEMSQRVATNFMAIAKEYSNWNAHSNLSYTHLLALLAVPTDDRDDFIEATHMVDGEEKTVDGMSTRELQRVIKERDEAKQQLAATQRDADQQRTRAKMREDMEQSAIHKLHVTEGKLERLKDENHLQRLDIARLESQPIDVAVQPPSAAEMESMRTVIRAEVINDMGLPDTYLAKKGAEEATDIFTDSVSGSVANGLIMAMRLDARSAAKLMEVYISTLVDYTQQLRNRLNIMREVDRGVKDGAGDVDW